MPGDGAPPLEPAHQLRLAAAPRQHGLGQNWWVQDGNLGIWDENCPKKVKWMAIVLGKTWPFWSIQLRRGRGWVFLSFLFRWNFFLDHPRHYQLETLLALVSSTNFLCRKSVVIIDIFMSLSVLAFCQSLFTSKCPFLDHKIWNWHARILVFHIIFSQCHVNNLCY